jgi:hypothetical protein
MWRVSATKTLREHLASCSKIKIVCAGCRKRVGTNGIFEGAYRFVKSNRVVVIVVVAVVVIVVAPKHNLLFEYVICNLESNLNSSSIHRRTETVTVVTNPMKKATHAINSLLYNNCRRFGSQSL